MRSVIFTFLFMVAWSFFGQNASAQDIYNAPPSKKDSAPTAEPDIPELQPAPPKEAMDINEAANIYYQQCMTKKHPMLDAENLKLMCGCTSSKIPEVMTLEQMKLLGVNSADGQEQRNRMLLFIYTPCIEYPTRAMVSYRCYSTPELKALTGNPAPICDCLSEGMGKYMREKAPASIERALQKNNKDLDPLAFMLQSRGYEIEERRLMQNCMDENGFFRQ